MFHVRIASESRTRLSFLELSILAWRGKGAQDCAQINPPHRDAGGGGQDKVVYLLRMPRLIVLALAADSDRNAGTGLGGLGTARWIIGGCFYSMRPASGESVTTRSMRALLAFQQVVSKKQLARLSVELCVKAVGQGDSSPFVPLSSSLDPQIGFTLQQGCRREGIEHRQNGAACVF